ncbi:hypothetical protein BCR35DRAFT_304672 [Leucosporidium creatinivorum]|uniref:Uncharacterized protein n=1 Tax=Leucosporidium creatinivorum TaxID=106004 RepID=A0A1Y2F5V1_9BASI|nr:hypothetical protein BCR35DRAFT_304672 [Leucosporidium creatinivorum]
MNAFPMLRSALRTRAPAFPRMYYSTAPSAPADSTAPAASSSSSSAASPPPARSSTLDEIQAGLRAKATQSSSSPNSLSFSPSPTSKRSAAESDKYKWEAHFNVSTSSARSVPPPSIPTPQDNWRTSQIVGYTAPVTTTSARSVGVLGGDVGRAFRKLNRVLRENNVRRELKRQERFESGSDKRVRLDSERHRRRFKVAVGKAVSLAMRMKDM